MPEFFEPLAAPYDWVYLLPPPVPNREEHPFLGTVRVRGIPVHVENLPGTVREGVGPDGRPWRTEMRAIYGEIPGWPGLDGEDLDAFVGPDPESDAVYVIHARAPAGAEGGPGQYDEDKVMLGYRDLDAAVASFRQHYSRPDEHMGDVTEISIPEFCHRYGASPEAIPLLKSLAVGRQDSPAVVFGAAVARGWLRKSTTPPGTGWMPIPNPKAGVHGFHRKKGSGWEYWYPGQVETPHQHRWERDLSIRTGVVDLKPGAVVSVGGRDGLYHYTPDHGDAPEGYAWVQSVSTGAVERVRASTVVPMRVEQPKEPPKRKEPPQRPPETPKPPSPPEVPDRPTRPALPTLEAVEGSQAKPGSVLALLESGTLPIARFKGADDTSWREGVEVPPARQGEFLSEFRGNVHAVARKVARTYRIPVTGQGGPTEAFLDVMASARLGLVMALSNYKGKLPFIPHAMAYMMTYASAEAAREMGAGVKLPEKLVMRPLKTFLAARAQAARETGDVDPSDQAIARAWRLKKREVTSAELGNYTRSGEDGDETVDQGNEEVPSGTWQVRSTDGTKVGAPIPGKLGMISEFKALVQGGKVQSLDWVQDNTPTLPDRDHLGVPVSQAATLRQETEDILEALPKKHGRILSLKFGFDDPEGEGATVEQIADAMGIAEGAPASTRRREVGEALKAATAAFEAEAKKRQSATRSYVARWARPEAGPMFEDGHGDRVSYRGMLDRFGTHEAVRMYQLALETGESDRVTHLLEQDQAGKLTTAQRQDLTTWYRQRTSERRQRQARQSTATQAVPRSAVSDASPNPYHNVGGIDPDHDAMLDVARGGSRG